MQPLGCCLFRLVGRHIRRDRVFGEFFSGAGHVVDSSDHQAGAVGHVDNQVAAGVAGAGLPECARVFQTTEAEEGGFAGAGGNVAGEDGDRHPELVFRPHGGGCAATGDAAVVEGDRAGRVLLLKLRRVPSGRSPLTPASMGPMSPPSFLRRSRMTPQEFGTFSANPFASMSAYFCPTGPRFKLGSMAVTMLLFLVTAGESLPKSSLVALSSGERKLECFPPATLRYFLMIG